MEKIKKDYKPKFVSLIVAMVFLFNSTTYGSTLSNRCHAEFKLRVPVKIDTERAREAIQALNTIIKLPILPVTGSAESLNIEQQKIKQWNAMLYRWQLEAEDVVTKMSRHEKVLEYLRGQGLFSSSDGSSYRQLRQKAVQIIDILKEYGMFSDFEDMVSREYAIVCRLDDLETAIQNLPECELKSNAIKSFATVKSRAFDSKGKLCFDDAEYKVTLRWIKQRKQQTDSLNKVFGDIVSTARKYNDIAIWLYPANAQDHPAILASELNDLQKELSNLKLGQPKQLSKVIAEINTLIDEIKKAVKVNSKKLSHFRSFYDDIEGLDKAIDRSPLPDSIKKKFKDRLSAIITQTLSYYRVEDFDNLRVGAVAVFCIEIEKAIRIYKIAGKLIAKPTQEGLYSFGKKFDLDDMQCISDLLAALLYEDTIFSEKLLSGILNNQNMSQDRCLLIYNLLSDTGDIPTDKLLINIRYKIHFLGKSLNILFSFDEKYRNEPFVLINLLYQLKELAPTLGKVIQNASEPARVYVEPIGIKGKGGYTLPVFPSPVFIDPDLIINQIGGSVLASRFLYENNALAHEFSHWASFAATDKEGRYFISLETWQEITKAARFTYLITDMGELVATEDFFAELAREPSTAYNNFLKVQQWQWVFMDRDKPVMYISEQEQQELKGKGWLVEESDQFYLIPKKGQVEQKIRIGLDTYESHPFSSPLEILAYVSQYAVYNSNNKSLTCRALVKEVGQQPQFFSGIYDLVRPLREPEIASRSLPSGIDRVRQGTL